MSARRRHGAGPPHRPDDTADSAHHKVEHRRQAAARRKAATTFRIANPGPHRERDYTCGKVRYPSAESARTKLALIRRNDQGQAYIPVRAYSCPACRGWHLTSWPAPDSPPWWYPGKPTPD